MSSLKVTLITNYCPPYRLPVFEALSSKSYSVKFVFTEKDSTRDNFGNLVSYVCKRRFELASILLRADFDVLVINFPFLTNYVSGLHAYLAAKTLRRKLVFWVEEWAEPVTLTRRLVRPLLKYMARHSDALVVCGTAAKDHMLSYGVSPNKIFLAPNASKIERPSIIQNTELKSQFVILFLGRLVKIKGVSYLIEAFSRLEKNLPQIRLWVVGEGPLKSQLENLATELGIENIDFKAASGDDRAYYYRNCDLFVLPSIWQPDHCEAWGMVVNEAMEFGKPIIVTDAVGAFPDLVKGGINGFVVKNSDSEALYQAMKKIAENPLLAKDMGKESLKIINEYTYEKMVEGFNKAILYAKTQK